MESRKLAALLSSLVSEIILPLLLLFPSSSSAPSLSSNPHSRHNFSSSSFPNLFPLIHHFLSLNQIATSLSLITISRKRKRSHLCPSSQCSNEDSDTEIPQLDPHRLSLSRGLDSLKNSFNMTSSTFEWLCGLLDPLLDCRDPVGSPLNLPTETRLGIGLFRLATGSEFLDIARRFGVSESASRFCVKQLCRVLCTNFRFWVGFPSPNELETVSKGFESLTGLPNCCGVIDCVKFRVVVNDDDDDVDIDDDGSGIRKSKGVSDSIVAQLVVDSSSRILSIIVRFHGDKSVYRILQLSSLYNDVEGNRLLNSESMNVNGVSLRQYFVGNAGYPLLPWLMVPFDSKMPGSSEVYFNAALSRMRVPAFRTISSLKNWGVLSRSIDEDLKTMVAYVGACSILHNALLMREDFSALCDGYEDPVCNRGSKNDVSAGLEMDSALEEGLVMRNALALIAKELKSSIN